MANFSDIFKKSFLEGFTGGDISTGRIAATLAVTALIALYIFVIYRVVTRKTFYSKTFNISLVALAVVTSAIILAMQSNLVISLGMVGALSIIRFRTAIKDPMDLVFLFWSISVGIRCNGNAGNSFPTSQGKDPSSRAWRRKQVSSGCGRDSRASSRVETGKSGNFLSCSKGEKDPLEVPDVRCD